MNDRNWLENLKVGDEVLISGGTLVGRDRLGKVSRFTKTQIIVNVDGHEDRFKKGSGSSVGDHGYYSTFLREATSESIAAYKEELYRVVFQNKIRNLSWNDVPLDILKQIRELIEPYIKRKEEKI